MISAKDVTVNYKPVASRRAQKWDRGAILKVGRGGGALTSDSKWGAGNTFSQQLLIIFKKVGVAEALPPAPPPPRAPAGAFTGI